MKLIGRDGTERRSPDFGGGIDYQEHDPTNRERIPLGGRSPDARERIPNVEGSTPPRMSYPRTPPEDQIPKGCSLHSMEPLREWFCKGADMTSAAEYEAALVQLEEEPPDIRQYNVNIREERWTNFSLEGVRFPAMTVDVIQRGEALAIFERDLIIHFQQISKAAALYVRALLGGIKRALEIYRRVDETTKNFPWSTPTTEEKWHTHAEGVLMVALTTLNLPTEAWKSVYHAESNDRHGYLWTLTNTLRLIFHMANEAGLETVLSAAYSLKHASDMEKSFPTQDEAFDKAKQMGLSPEQAARQITSTPGQFALYDAKKGEIVKSDRWRPPDFRSLVKIAQTEQGRSEVSCVLEEHENLLMAKPMIFSEETGPTHFTFANQVGVQTDDDSSDGSVPEELARTIQSHLWLANLEISSGVRQPGQQLCRFHGNLILMVQSS